LRGDPNATPAHRPEVWQAFAESLPGHHLECFEVRDAAGLAGGCAAMVQRRAGLRWIHAMPMLLPGTPLARAGEHAAVDASVGLGFAALQKDLHAVGGEWALYRPLGPTVDISSLSVPGGKTRVLETAVIELDQGIVAARKGMDRKTRQAISRARARGVVFAEEPDALPNAYALHVRQSKAWPGHRPLPIELSRRLLLAKPSCGIEDPVARLFTVRDGRGLLSCVFALDHPRETFLWWSGTHPDGRSLQAFAVLLWGVVEWAAARGRTRVNFGASAGLESVAAFKDSLGAALLRSPVRWLGAGEASWAGRVAGTIQERLRRRRARGTES
jgi:hypothetical protein